MTSTPSASTWTVLLLDIEGTTTPITFVHDVLFPYARTRLPDFIAVHRGQPDVLDAIARLRAEHTADARAGVGVPDWPDSDDRGLVRYLEFLMDRDRKSPGLKVLQGLIWDEGYRRGDLHGVVFDTVVPAMRRCRAAGKRIAIYSSGSVLAQKLLFSTTPDGDLTTMIDGFFDTGVGAKVEPASYSRIASLLGVAPGEILFLTDATAEVTAARAAGVQAVIVTSPSVFETISGV